MVRLPSVGGDDGSWGTLLNEFLQVIHNSDGSLKTTGQVLVAPSTAADSVKSVANYECDGTNDQVEINAAIQALGSTGGRVVLLAGSYSIADTLLLDQENTELWFEPGAEVTWSSVTGTVPLFSIQESNCHVMYPNLTGSGSKGNGVGILIGGENTDYTLTTPLGEGVHGCNIYF